MRKRSELLAFSKTELVEELVRLLNSDEVPEPEHYCDECENFVPHQAPSENYNPCRLKHRMKFKSPQDYGDSFGFYRSVCTDRSLLI